MFKKMMMLFVIVLMIAGCTSTNNEGNTSQTPYTNNSSSNKNENKPAENKSEVEVEVNEELKMTVEISQIKQDASDGKENEGKETINVKQAKISFNYLPKTIEDVKAIDRTGEDGKFITMALLICGFKTWNPDDTLTCEEIMKELMNSPTIKDSYTNFTRSFVKERMLQNDKWEYIADAYFDGAESINAYLPEKPLTITMKEYPYLPQTSTMYGTTLSIDKVVIEFEGADTSRNISVYQDPSDSKWYIWSDSYKGLLADIKFPAK